MTPRKKTQTAVLFVRTPDAFKVEIDKIAEEEIRTAVSVVNHAIKEYLEKRGRLPETEEES